LEHFFDYLAVRLDGQRAEGRRLVVNWVLPDVPGRYVLTLDNCALTYLAERRSDGADATVTLDRATLNGLVLRELTFADAAAHGPSVIGVRGAEAVDLTRSYPTVSHLLNVAKPGDVRAAIARAPVLGTIDGIVANSVEGRRDPSRPWMLAPCDLHAVMASGVT